MRTHRHLPSAFHAIHPGIAACGAVVGAALVAGHAASQVAQPSSLDQIGLTALKQRLGDAAPTGATLSLMQVEGSQTAYKANPTHSQLAGKSIVEMSGPTGIGTHATSVAVPFTGVTKGASQGSSTIFAWNMDDFIQGYLKSAIITSEPPIAPPPAVRTMNHSWVVSKGVVFDLNTLRRADLAMHRDGLLMVSAVPNLDRPALETLLACSFNGLAAGRADGNHRSGLTAAHQDIPGRSKPEIVAPGGATSYATPLVTGVATLLFETALIDPAIASDPLAQRPEVVKAAMLAGALHRAGWSNNPVESGPMRGMAESGLDPVYGVDLVHVDRSHMVLTGGRQPGGSAAEPGPAGPFGWDLAPVSAGQSRMWYFTLTDWADEISVAATWNRIVDEPCATAWIADFDLYLWRIGPDGYESLVGDGGLGWFDSGNVTSQSPVNNIEHLYVRFVAPGDYAIELRRADSGAIAADCALAWFNPWALMPDPDGSPDLPGGGMPGGGTPGGGGDEPTGGEPSDPEPPPSGGESGGGEPEPSGGGEPQGGDQGESEPQDPESGSGEPPSEPQDPTLPDPVEVQPQSGEPTSEVGSDEEPKDPPADPGNSGAGDPPTPPIANGRVGTSGQGAVPPPADPRGGPARVDVRPGSGDQGEARRGVVPAGRPEQTGRGRGAQPGQPSEPPQGDPQSGGDEPPPAPVFGDLDGNGVVDFADLGLLLTAWGTSNPVADLNVDGIVDGADLGYLLGML